MPDRTHSHLALVAVVASAAAGLVLVIGSGCTVLTNDALPDDAGVFEGGDAARTATCASCLSAACTAAQAMCLTSAGCIGVIECASPTICDTTCKTACGCNATGTADAGPSAERLHHAFTACNDARITACAADCAAENRTPATLPGCGGNTDAGVADASPLDAATTDAAATDAATDAAPPTVPGVDGCIACASNRCAPALAGCASGTECQAFLACSSVCTTGSCVDDCARLHGTGKVSATELATCTSANCQNDCEL